MGLSLLLTAGVVAASATLAWRKWAGGLSREQGFDELLDSARRDFDTPFTFRTLQRSDAEWAASLNAATPDIGELPSGFVRMEDVMFMRDGDTKGAIRSFVSGDGRMNLFVTCTRTLPAVIGFASYATEARVLTVRTETWPTRSPISRVRHVKAEASMFELLQAHLAHVAGETVVAVTNTGELVHQFERMERLEQEWRDSQSEETLHERDLRALVGDRYDPGIFRMKRRSAIPRARASRSSRGG